ncbi:NINE protein [Streptomyces sp. SID5785]|uniref:TM2 domain-containing protein n=1 Tax=Streptomyces sp. SID5785 TaxID=2690309 RepID=UPI001361B3B1|nr:TM2 domain-containing protein [Streptomyces sp. SID5785]MZD07190.1 NINE protein [Streptomyces sp. SID5785]
MSDSNPYGQPPQDPNNPYGYPQQGSQPGYGAPGQPPQGGQPMYGYPYPDSAQAGGAYPPQPGMVAGYDPMAPFGYDPYGRPYSDKSKIVAGVLQLFLGTLGVGRFYIGNVGIGLAQLFTCGGFGIWALIDGIILLTSSNTTDSNGRVLRG